MSGVSAATPILTRGVFLCPDLQLLRPLPPRRATPPAASRFRRGLDTASWPRPWSPRSSHPSSDYSENRTPFYPLPFSPIMHVYLLTLQAPPTQRVSLVSLLVWHGDSFWWCTVFFTKINRSTAETCVSTCGRLLFDASALYPARSLLSLFWMLKWNVLGLKPEFAERDR